MLQIILLGCMFVLSSSRNVPQNTPLAYRYQSYGNVRNNYPGNYMNQAYSYNNDINMDPGNYEINVDHQKYIPMIEGRPIYIPPIIKPERITPVKQYPKDSRPWHYWKNAQMPKYGYVNEKHVMKTESPFYDEIQNYDQYEYPYEYDNEINSGRIPDLNENMNAEVKDQFTESKAPESAEHFHNQKYESLKTPKPKLGQNQYAAFDDKVGEIAPSFKKENSKISPSQGEDFKKANKPDSSYKNTSIKTSAELKSDEKTHASGKNESTSKLSEPFETSTKSPSEDSQENLDDVDYSVVQERNKDCEDCEPESGTDLEQKANEKKFLDNIDLKVRSLVFNPAAKSTEKFQNCITPKNESGSCRYVQHCLLPSIIGTIGQFMNYVCIINDRFIGVCCPEYPVTTIKVEWDSTESLDDNSAVSSPEACGVSSRRRIVGGQKADPKDYPWMAALLTMSSGQFYCGGSLINNRYVLTAAHCTFGIPRDQILVRLGEYDFSDESSSGEDYPVTEIKRHGQYSRRTLHNDIALLKLGKPVSFTNRITTICLPGNKTFEGENATLAGWGNVKGGGPNSDVLQEATFPVVSNKKCADTHGLPVSKDAICTLATPHDKGACNGDSGGPLMALNEESKHWYVIGVVSWGRRGCDPKFPTVYAGVSNYQDWIETHAV